MFDWDAFHKYECEMHKVEESTINKCFLEFIRGNSSYDDMSSAEIESHCFVFKTGWIISQLLSEH